MNPQHEARIHYENDEIEYWLKVRREAASVSLTPLEDAAKQIVVITSLLQGVYFAAISFSGVKQVSDTSNVWFNIFLAISLITIIFWIMSLYYATRVFIPESYKADFKTSDLAEEAVEIRTAYEKISVNKHDKLTTSVQFLWFSFVPFTINIFVYLIFLPSPPSK